MFHLNLVAWLFHYPQSTYRHTTHQDAGFQQTRPTTPEETILLRLTDTRRNAGERMGTTRISGDPLLIPKDHDSLTVAGNASYSNPFLQFSSIVPAGDNTAFSTGHIGTESDYLKPRRVKNLAYRQTLSKTKFPNEISVWNN